MSRAPQGLQTAYRTAYLTIRDTWFHTKDAKLLMVASSLAYITILSLVPLLAVSFFIFQAFGGIDWLYKTIEPFVLQNLAEGADEQAMTAIRGFLGNIHGGALGAGGVVGLIFTSMSMLSNIEKGINEVWRAPMNRSLFQRIASYWFFVTLGPLALSFALGAAATTHLPLTQFLPNGTGLFAITSLLFFFIYKCVPNRKVDTWPAAIAAVSASAMWDLGRVGFSIYTKKFVTYDKIYGSLGAIPILLLWIYIGWVIVLTGAALNVTLQKRFDLK